MNLWRDAEGADGDWSRPLANVKQAVSEIAPLDAQLSHFVDLVRGEVAVPRVSGADGLAALQLVEAVSTAARSRTAIRIDLTALHQRAV